VSSAGGHRIGEFARRVGVTPELLRAWEQRYGLLQPLRTPGGFRLYGEEDASRVARMRRALDDGLSAAEAARVALAAAPPPANGLIAGIGPRLLAAIESYDEAAAERALDEAFAAFALEAVVGEVILPTLRTVGSRWEQGSLGIGHEHFASNVIRGRLLGLARLWGRGAGRLVLLACAPGEQHDISLLAFGLILRSHGRRIVFLGADTPLETLEQAVGATGAAAVVLSTFDGDRLAGDATALRRLARTVPLFLGGPGASLALTARLRVGRLDGDLIEAAREVAAMANG